MLLQGVIAPVMLVEKPLIFSAVEIRMPSPRSNKPISTVLRLLTVLAILGWRSFSPAADSSYLDPAGIQGSLVIAGGGELPTEIIRRFMNLAGGEKAKIIVIPTASDQADDLAANPERKARLIVPWKTLGAASVQILHTRAHEKAN